MNLRKLLHRSDSGHLYIPWALFVFPLLSLSFSTLVSTPAQAYNDCIEGNGVTTHNSRKAESFTTLEVNGSFNVFVTCGLPEEISITADSNILPHVLTTVNNGKMVISAARSICTKNPVIIKISVPTLKTITNEGAGEMEVTKIHNETFVASTDGAVTLRLQGTTRKLTLHAAGSSSAQTTELKANEVTVKTFDSATAVVLAEKSLEAECHDASELKYSGMPTSKKMQAFDACDLNTF